jgi:hypothetical protein
MRFHISWPLVGSIAVGVATFVGVSVATGGLADLGLLGAGAAMLLASVVSGVASQAAYDGFSRKRPGKDLLVAAGLSVALLPLGPIVQRVAGAAIAPIVERTGLTALGRVVGGQAAQAAARVEGRAALRSIAEEALARGAQSGTAGSENAAHIARLVAMARSDPAALSAAGIDQRAAEMGILYSDLGKNPEYLEPYANKLFGNAQGLNRFKAFLLHEEPGIELLREQGAKLGLPQSEIESYVAAIRGHNGPSVGWWGENWNKFIASAAEDARNPLIGKPYPMPATPEAAFHAALDRVDQGGLTMTAEGLAGGPKKIMFDNLAMGQSLETAARGALEGNPAGTLEQLATLKAAHPQVFDVPAVAEGVARVEATPGLMARVAFTDGGTAATIQTAQGPVVARTFDEFWAALSQSPPSQTAGIEGSLSTIH